MNLGYYLMYLLISGCVGLCYCVELFLVAAGGLCARGLQAHAAAAPAADQGLCTHGFSRCCVWTHQLWCMGFVSPSHVESSQTGEQSCVPCIGR